MPRWLALTVGLVAGCADPGVQHCADGTICPPGTACGTPAGCVSPGDCGDGVVSGDELCDDGNNLGGDGCAADCRSDEICGDGALDPALGEECDDGNLLSHDGCSSGCLAETATWHAHTGSGPSARRYAAVVWDADRGRAVLYGGGDRPTSGTTRSNETWLWSAGWTAGPAGPFPTGLWSHAIASNGRGTMLLFGGETTDSECQSPTDCQYCAAWTGDAWAACPAGALPSGRSNLGMATGPDGTIIIACGVAGQGAPSWRWSEAGWTQLVGGPSNVIDPGAAFDPIANKAVVSGGFAADTWRWDGTSWVASPRRTERIASSMVYDPARRRMVVVAGQKSGGIFAQDVLEWDGTGDYLPITTAGTRPPPRYGQVAFYDPLAHAVVVFGGTTFTTMQQTLGDTWLLRWESATPDDACDGTDRDGDGLAGCADPDCWARCTPRCPPGAACDPGAPRCGDGTCNPFLEDAALCPDDC